MPRVFVFVEIWPKLWTLGSILYESAAGWIWTFFLSEPDLDSDAWKPNPDSIGYKNVHVFFFSFGVDCSVQYCEYTRGGGPLISSANR
jgi:hypothetical protein